jgi:hypothetical protein
MPAQPRVRFIPRREHRDPERAEIEAARAIMREFDDDIDRHAVGNATWQLMQALKKKRKVGAPIA